MIYYLIYSTAVGLLCLILFLLLRGKPKQKGRLCDHCAHLKWKCKDGWLTVYRCSRHVSGVYSSWDGGPTVCQDYAPNETAPGVAVRHGRWIKREHGNGEYGFPDGSVLFHCSLCDWARPHNNDNYCPNCGAKMDGGDDNG